MQEGVNFHSRGFNFVPFEKYARELLYHVPYLAYALKNSQKRNINI